MQGLNIDKIHKILTGIHEVKKNAHVILYSKKKHRKGMIQDDNKGLLIKPLPSMKNIKLENNWDQVVLEIFP